MQGFRSTLKQYSYLPATIYLMGLVLYGMWTGLEHVHWSVPFIMAGLSIVLSSALDSAYPAGTVSAAAVMLAIYGLGLQLNIAWYAAAALIIAGLVVCILVTVGLNRLDGGDKDVAAGGEQ
ncbi:hypothetical protein WL29_21110 [Burkholderia ubonensis]|uniref:Uncharacterized protein n=1 Tax=Burkholderia ubonensis TaxID=101571 RepID=A0A106QCP7_9BURK|nr:hypothetical protein [Burkholderia ubonensis]KWA83868.1 hypothetical protein WL29_21110 [Burkholderia ubonensis]